MAYTEIESITAIDIDILHPGKYKVVLLNDDTTPMDFVIALLMQVFHHSQEAAVEITNKVHNEGKGVAGVYSHEVAEQKGIESTVLARQHGWPLAIKIEEE